MRLKKILSAVTGALLFLTGCASGTSVSGGTESDEALGSAGSLAAAVSAPESQSEPTLEPAPDPTDDNCRVFYQIFVGSFSDSNGDGIGDLRGVINRLDYLNDGNINSGKSLGVQGIWLSPIFSSGSYHKYDVIDYYSIARQFGTEADLRELIEECHKRNVKVILDLPINHTSDSHRWFQSFVKARQDNDTANEYYDYYITCTLDEQLSGHGYHLITGTDLYYECNFSEKMPELNFDNENVRRDALDIAKHYLELGADGFRFDAAKYIYYRNHAKSAAFWEWYMSELRAAKPDVYCVGEVWASDADVLQYYGAMNCFDFTVSQAEGVIALAAKGGNIDNFTNYAEKYLRQIEGKNDGAMFIPFIANHDTDRAASALSVGFGQMNMAANLYLLCSGSPFIYYGEEIGMKGSRGTANTDANRRLAMLWGDGDTVKDPEGTTYDKNKQSNGTAAGQLDDADSLYNYYRRLIAIRVRNPEIARGSYKALFFDEKNVGGFAVDYNGSVIAIIHNTSQEDAVTVELAKGTDKQFANIAEQIGTSDEKAVLEGGKLTLPPQTSVILR